MGQQNSEIDKWVLIPVFSNTKFWFAWVFPPWLIHSSKSSSVVTRMSALPSLFMSTKALEWGNLSWPYSSPSFPDSKHINSGFTVRSSEYFHMHLDSLALDLLKEPKNFYIRVHSCNSFSGTTHGLTEILLLRCKCFVSKSVSHSLGGFSGTKLK